MSDSKWEMMVTDYGNKIKQIEALQNATHFELTDEMVAAVCKVAIETFETKVRQAAIDLLRLKAEEEAANIFSMFAQKGNDRQRRWAFMNLALIQCRSKMEIVLKGLVDPVNSVQRAAAMNVGLYQDQDFLKAIESYFEHNLHAFFHESIFRVTKPIRHSIYKIKSKFSSTNGTKSRKIESA